ncbi:MAG: hypothetical protein OEW43_01405 [Elusimicrobiota bacterium]|nr:hypothetical protein [Elusimicrobiota bacterium]
MREKIFLLLFLVLCITAAPAFAELEVSGFVDVLGQGRQGENTTFGMGAFEIDFASEFSSKVSFEGAVVVEGGEVGLGQTLVDFMLLNEDRLGVQVGLLDMPFGIDYQVFATPDRKLVTTPLVTELMMDGGWGDIGVNLHGAVSLLNYNLYVVNGMGEDGGVPVNQITDNNSAKSVGGRIGVLPIKDLELGFSYVQGPYLDGTARQALSRIAGDIQFAYERLQIKGEFVRGEEEVPGGTDNEHQGYYIQLLGEATEKVYGVTRFGYWKPKGGDRVTRITIGLGYDLIENVSLRGEYQINDETPSVDNNLFSMQAVLSF